jgi:hypothetical protein
VRIGDVGAESNASLLLLHYKAPHILKVIDINRDSPLDCRVTDSLAQVTLKVNNVLIDPNKLIWDPRLAGGCMWSAHANAELTGSA